MPARFLACVFLAHAADDKAARRPDALPWPHFEKRWKRIQDQLRIQMNGDEQPTFSSGRTLFGIRSAAEEKMDRFAREIEEEARQRRLARGEGGRKAAPSEHGDAPSEREDAE